MIVMAGHSRSKNGVASLRSANVPAIPNLMRGIANSVGMLGT